MVGVNLMKSLSSYFKLDNFHYEEKLWEILIQRVRGNRPLFNHITFEFHGESYRLLYDQFTNQFHDKEMSLKSNNFDLSVTPYIVEIQSLSDPSFIYRMKFDKFAFYIKTLEIMIRSTNEESLKLIESLFDLDSIVEDYKGLSTKTITTNGRKYKVKGLASLNILDTSYQAVQLSVNKKEVDNFKSFYWLEGLAFLNLLYYYKELEK